MAKKSKDPPPEPAPKPAKNAKNAITKDEPPKPTRGLNIGDNFGWTGKLPATLLFEHCQKQKWNKPVFDMINRHGGFICIVKLQWEYPKTKELITIQMKPDYEPKQTSNEARHASATYTLYRINYKKNYKMILPIIFRDYWSDLEVKRAVLLKNDRQKHDALYNENPFTVYIEQKEASAKKQKELEKQKELQKRNEKPKTITIESVQLSSRPPVPKPQKNSEPVAPLQQTSFPRKVWDAAPFFDIESNLRISIENNIKKHITWDSHDDAFDETEAASKLARLGFRQLHIEECLQHTRSFNDALEWLLFYLPEDDLPAFFTKSDKDTKVTLKIAKDLKTELLFKRLRQSGFNHDDLIQAYQRFDGDEVKISLELCWSLLSEEDRTFGYDDVEDPQVFWNDEVQCLENMGLEKYNILSDAIFEVQMDCRKLEPGLLSCRIYRPPRYPNQHPGLHIIVNNSSFKLPNYIKLSIIKHTFQYMNTHSLVGDCYIYSIIEYLKENIHKIIANPGALVEEKGTPLERAALYSQKLKTMSKSRNVKITDDDITKIKQSYENRQKSSEMQQMIKQRTSLPAWAKREELINLIKRNKVSLITGETGSGKSTQIVQFLLDDLNAKGDFQSSIVVTQPRRISTIGLADRISQERAGKVGDEVGYVIRGENKTSKLTRISFVTTGVLLRILQNHLTDSKASMFANLKYLVIDEVHERSVDSDFLLILLKSVSGKLPKLKIVLMSATIDKTIFDNFFKSSIDHTHIEGRTFPIEDFYLDHILEKVGPSEPGKPYFTNNLATNELISRLCMKVDQDLGSDAGSILIFMPGVMEISSLIQKIQSQFSDSGKKAYLIPLHSALSSAEQREVFKPIKNARKIVVSTNIAETSITIPDCVVVIDGGRSKMMFFSEKLNATQLIESWCSKAEIMQRRGRAGRIQKGKCYHLYSEETVEHMLPQPIPEIKRTNLDNLYLIIKSMGIKDVERFLLEGLDAPSTAAIKSSEVKLVRMGAMVENKLTTLGKYLSFIPADINTGKLLILGCILGCLEKALTLAAIKTMGTPFSKKFEHSDANKRLMNEFASGQGDLIGAMEVVEEYRRLKQVNSSQANQFLKENNLYFMVMKDILSTRVQYMGHLRDLGFVPFKFDDTTSKTLNRNTNRYEILQAIITASLYPQVAWLDLPDAKYFKTSAGAIEMRNDTENAKIWIENPNTAELPARRAFLHPASVAFTSTRGRESDPVPHDEFIKEDGTIDYEKANSLYRVDAGAYAPSLTNAKSQFIMYGNLHQTQKLYIREVTFSTAIAVILFGGDVSYQLAGLASGRPSPGVVIDDWLPIRTWCKNGVLIKKLRLLLDQVLENKLSRFDRTTDDDILSTIENLLTSVPV